MSVPTWRDDVVTRANAGEELTRIAEAYGITRQAVRGILRRRGVPGRPLGKLSTAQHAELTEKYVAGESIAILAASYGIAESSVRALLRRRGVWRKPTPHTLRHDAFDKLTPDASYWAGFLFADGSVSYREGHLPQISVGLAERDREHLYELRAFLGSTSSISVNQVRRSCQFSVRSEHLADRLCALGRYSESISVDLATSRDFWRGVSDGDGSIGAYQRRKGEGPLRAQFRVVGRMPLLDAFVGFLRTHGVDGLSVRPHKTIYNVGTTGGPALKIIELLYGGATTSLARKAEMAKGLIVAEHLNGPTDTITVAAQPHPSHFVDMAILERQAIGVV